MSALANDLETGFQILWYKIESVLGRGGFGITYLAEDTNLHQRVAIKEYLPHDFAARSGDSTVQPASEDQSDMYSWGLERFMSEAQTLAKFKHPNIVRVLSVFKHNNTGYMVMEYEVGRDLNVIFKEKKKLTQKELENIYYPVMDGLAAVHKEGFIHRDIKPANIYIREDGSPVLLDFGAARQAVGGKTKTLTSMLSVGYAPFEQYNDGSGKQGPWTDIYALSACLYQGITGTKPSESTLRGMALLHDEADPYEPLSQRKLEGYSHDFLRAIDQGLMLQIHDRPQSLEEFMGMLKGEIKLEDLPPRNKKESPAAMEETVIRPVKPTVPGHEVTATENMEVTSTEQDDIPTKKAQTDHHPKAPEPAQISRLWGHSSKILVGLVAVILLIITVVALIPGEKSPEQIRQAEIQNLLKQAHDYYENGNFVGKDQDNAVALYRQVLSLQADNKSALDNLQKVTGVYLSRARQAIESKDYRAANKELKIAASISPTSAEVKGLQSKLTQLVKSKQKFNQLKTLLGKASSAKNNGLIYTPEKNSALDFYQQVLRINPGNTNALLGLSEVSDRILSDARVALKDNNLVQAKRLVDLAESINLEKPAIQNLKKQLAASTALSELIARADKAFERKQYTKPAGGSALELYDQVLALSPGNAHALSRKQEMANFYADKAGDQIRAGRLNNAQTNINTLDTYFPDFSGTDRLTREVSEKRKLLARKKVDPLKAIRPLIPPGINQKQNDDLVVQDIVEVFMRHFENRDLNNLKKVTSLNKQQESLYASLFKLYKSISLQLVPQSFTVNKNKGLASVKFVMSDLVNIKGHTVQTSAGWTKLNLSISKKSGYWLKAQIK